MSANYSVGSVGYDTTFELNEFNEPRLRSELETLKDVLLFVLFSKPGSYPSLPQIGLNIEDMLYSYYDEIDVDDLKSKITEQCAMLGSYISAGTIDIRKLKYKGQPSLIIHMEGRETFPVSYKNDQIGNSDRYMIGITFDELNQMIYNINHRSD